MHDIWSRFKGSMRPSFLKIKPRLIFFLPLTSLGGTYTLTVSDRIPAPSSPAISSSVLFSGYQQRQVLTACRYLVSFSRVFVFCRLPVACRSKEQPATAFSPSFPVSFWSSHSLSFGLEHRTQPCMCIYILSSFVSWWVVVRCILPATSTATGHHGHGGSRC